MKLIVAADAAWGIGRDNKLLYSIPEDMAFFKAATQGKVVVMGHSTLRSLPRSAPLPNRTNIVLSRDEGLVIEGARVCHSLAQLGGALAGYNPGEVFVIGGEAVYRLLLGYCSEALVTKIAAHTPADSFFPNLDEDARWTLRECSETKSHEGLEYRFCVYVNGMPKALPCGTP